MDTAEQARAKAKPPRPPPKPSHLTAQDTTTPTPTSTLSNSTTAPEPSNKSQKRGLGWPWDFPSTLFPLFSTTSPTSNSITWLFNWELWVPQSLPSTINWVPCVRTAGQCTDIIPFLTDISQNQGRRITHFLGFNEPEIASQANLPPEEAARLWTEFVIPAKEKFGFRLGSPGMSSDVSRSVPWLDRFFGQLGGLDGARVDFLVLHWYGLKFEDMRRFLEMMHARYGVPVWVNEFACSSMGDGEAAFGDVEAFLREAIPLLEGCDWIERYAYFGNGQGLDVGTWVGRASNFTEVADGYDATGGRRLSRTGKLYLEL